MRKFILMASLCGSMAMMSSATAAYQESDAKEKSAADLTKASTDESEAVSDKKDPNRKVCKKIQVTGRLIKSRECRTAAQWQALAEAEKREANDIVDNGNKGHTTGG